MPAPMLTALVFGALAAAGVALVLFSGVLVRMPGRRRRVPGQRGGPEERGSAAAARMQRSTKPLARVQLGAAAGGGLVGWAATGLVGMVVLLAGMGALLPPFMAAPRRRRRQTQHALAWSLWSRQLAEQARSGSGLADSLRGSVAHAPEVIAPTIARIANTAEMHGLERALDDLAAQGSVWEPEVAAGLRMATTSGGGIAGPLLDLCGRIADVVELHRAKTEAVVALWTQTIALLSLSGGVVVMMYRTNPDYFEPYREGTGQLVLTGFSGLLLMVTGFLVYNSVVRDEYSVLVPPRRRNRAKDPL